MGRTLDRTTGSMTAAEDTAGTADTKNTDQRGDLDSSPTRHTFFAVAAVSVLVIGLITAVIVMMFSVRANAGADRRDALVVDTAKQVVVNLTTLDFNSADADIDRILQGTSGAFRQQFADSSGSFREVLQRGEVGSTGEVKEAGLVRVDDDNAQVLVAVASVVKNLDAPQGEARVYRMMASLEHSGDAWLVSDVEFVS